MRDFDLLTDDFKSVHLPNLQSLKLENCGKVCRFFLALLSSQKRLVVAMKRRCGVVLCDVRKIKSFTA